MNAAPPRAMYVVNVAATGVNFPYRISPPLTAPTGGRHQAHDDQSQRHEAGCLAVHEEERCDDHQDPGQGSHRQIDAGHHEGDCLAEAR